MECVKDVFGKMGAGQSCDDVVQWSPTFLLPRTGKQFIIIIYYNNNIIDTNWSTDRHRSAAHRLGTTDVVDVVRLRQKENGSINRPIIVEFRSEYEKWTVMRMKANLRECEEYRSVFLEMDLTREEREIRKARVMKLKEERIQKERQQE